VPLHNSGQSFSSLFSPEANAATHIWRFRSIAIWTCAATKQEAADRMIHRLMARQLVPPIAAKNL
jgi:hypothetical protein